MFKKEYQGGTHVEVLSAQGRDPLAPWKLTGSVSRKYVKDVRSYVVIMEGGPSTTNTRMQLPKTDKASLGLVQPYLVLQFMVPDGARVAIDLGVMDSSGSRRRIQMSTSQREMAVTPLNARVPLSGVITGQWVNLCIDLGSLVSGLFKAQSYKSLEGVSIGGSCILRRVFTLKSSPPDTTGTELSSPFEDIPRACQMPTSVATAQTQVISYASVSSPSYGKPTSPAGAVSTMGSFSSENTVTADERPTHIAFGKKVTIPDHILGSKQSNRSALSSRLSSADSARSVREITQVDGQSFQPRPPSKPADPAVLRVQKKRVRMVSGGTKKPEAMSPVSKTVPSSTSVDSVFQTGFSEAISDESTAYSVETGHADSSLKTEQQASIEDYLDQDEHLALSVLKYKGNAQENYMYSTASKVNEERQIDRLNSSGISENSTDESQMLNTSVTSNVKQLDLDSSVDEVLYLYRSLPRSAERKQSDFKESLEGGRSADLEADFVSPVKKANPKSSILFAPPVVEVRLRSSQQKDSSNPMETGNQNSGSPPHDQLNETRLSDDYDWRQYASVDDTDLTQSEQSLRTRLANAVSLEQGTPRASIGPLKPDTEMEATLSGSVTLSGWTEKFKDAAINPVHDSLDIRDMGGMLSPLSGTLTEETDFVRDREKATTEGEELELMYDPQLNCFYDPVTGSTKEGEPFRYDIYPSLFFEKPPNHCGLTEMKDDFSKSVSLFERTPGTGFDSFLSAHPGLEDQATNTLYHGLVHSTVEDINTPLGLPLLPYGQDNITLLPQGETSVACPSTTDGVSSPTKEQASVYNTAAGSSQELFSWPPNGDVPDSIREWEGWQTCSRQYLCDGPETCLPHAVELCLSRYCSLGGMAQSEVEGGSSLESKVIRDLDNLPMVFINTFQEGGSVSRMFGEAVQSLQDYFRAQLHQLAGEASGLTLSLSSNWILPSVKFLMSIWNDVRNLPKGLALLDALYDQTYQVAGTPHYLLLLHLLAQALAPYFKFVEQWVFQGWLDMGEEFGLHVSVEALARRDDKYWSEGYTASGGCAPGFLEGQAHTILTCGKALNLLRICKPSHPLCTGMFRPPKLRVQLSLDRLEQCDVQCQYYRREVQESEQVRHDLLKQELLAKEKELRAEVLKARQEARAHAEKLKMMEESNKAQEKEKKVALRDALLEQIQTNQALRSEHEAEERTQDAEQLDYFSSRNTLHDASLQEKARDDMITYYAGLSREAELRQLRAEWRAKRYKLSTQRFEFLRSEKDRFTAESEKAAKLATPQLPSINSLLKDTSLNETSATSLIDVVSAKWNVSKNTSNSVVGKTLAESSSQREQVTQEQASSRTWIASFVDQPEQFGVQGDVKSLQDHDHFMESEPQDQFSLEDKSYSDSTQPVNSTLLLQSSYPPSVVQNLLYNQETTDPTILSRLSQITVPSLHVRSGPGEQPSVVQELLYPTQHAQLTPVQKEGAHEPVSSRGQEASSTAQDIIYMYGSGESTKKCVTTRGNEPGSTAQDIMYGSDLVSTSRPLIQEPGHPLLISTRGQAPRSTAQLKMYPLRQATQEKEEVVIEKPDKRELNIPTIESGPSIKYTDDFPFNDDPSSRDMLSAVLGPAVQDNSDIDTGFLSVYPLSALIEQSLALPILTQSTLVNEALLRYFLSECHITHHFNVIKWFLLLEDGEFGHALSTRLCEELTHGRDWRVLVSPSFLNPLLSTALEVSVHSRCPEAQRLSFALKYRPTSVNTHAIDALEFLELKYEVDWPCNIVITSTSVEKYNKILQLLLQMKRASWVLQNTFHQLKVSKQLSPSQTRQLQVYRHEYQHFVNVMHGYIANQVFQITWREFEIDLENDVHSFEELIQAHHNFINKAIFRCLLSKKAAPIMKLIQNIFSSILKFSSELTRERVCAERSYAAMAETHTRFREVSGLLIKVVDKLVQRGYQPHLEDFLLRLNFNRFYK